jgi:hypothetical protein
MEDGLKILWVHDDFDGPVNGLALYNGEKVWFTRVQLPFIVESPDEALVKVEEPVRTYNLSRLSPDDLKFVEDNHLTYCQETGAPLNHGDPMIIKSRATVVRPDLKEVIPEGQDSIEVETEMRTLISVKQYHHRYDPNQVDGEFICCVKETDFINYRVPRRVIRE